MAQLKSKFLWLKYLAVLFLSTSVNNGLTRINNLEDSLSDIFFNSLRCFPNSFQAFFDSSSNPLLPYDHVY